MGKTARGFGVYAGIPLEVSHAVAVNAEALGYDSFWTNSPGSVDGLTVLAAAAAETQQIKLGIGVIPLNTRAPASIIAGVEEHALPLDRLLLGIGSQNPGGLQRVREGIQELRSRLTAKIVVAALGPKMCRLAGELADGVLFNWLTPDFARISADWVREGAAVAGRQSPTLYAYQRVALGKAATERLTGEAGNYARIPVYAQHFNRMGKTPLEASIASDTPEGIQIGLAAWDGIVDEVVVRGIVAADTVEANLELLRAAAPR